MNEATISEISSKTAALLLDIGAIKINYQNPFRWSSGWTSPIYCDNRIVLSHVGARNQILAFFIQAIREYYKGFDGIAGVATAGIPLGALVAQELQLPMVYVRSQSKAHGMNNQVEGDVKMMKKPLIIEDLISTGASSINVARTLKRNGLEIAGIGAIMNYGFPLAEKNFLEEGIGSFSLTNYSQILIESVKRNHITEDEMAVLYEWRKSPDQWKGIV